MPGKPDHLGTMLPPLPRLLWGTALIPLLLFQHHWEAQLILTILFASLAILAGKRIRFLYFFFMAGSIALFNLITPFGRVLWQLGPWPITEGALTGGIGKGISIAGLVFASLFSVSRELRLPGRFGGLLTRTFVFYDELLSEKKSLQPKALVISIDRLLERLYRPGEAIALTTLNTDPQEARPSHPIDPVERHQIGLGILLIATSLAVGIALLFWR